MAPDGPSPVGPKGGGAHKLPHARMPRAGSLAGAGRDTSTRQMTGHKDAADEGTQARGRWRDTITRQMRGSRIGAKPGPRRSALLGSPRRAGLPVASCRQQHVGLVEPQAQPDSFEVWTMPHQCKLRPVGRVEPQAQPDSSGRRIVGLRFAAPDLRHHPGPDAADHARVIRAQRSPPGTPVLGMPSCPSLAAGSNT